MATKAVSAEARESGSSAHEPVWLRKMLAVAEYVYEQSEVPQRDTSASGSTENALAPGVKLVVDAHQRLGGIRFAATGDDAVIYPVLDTSPASLEPDLWETLRNVEHASSPQEKPMCLFEAATSLEYLQKVGQDSAGLNAVPPPEKYVDHNLDNRAAFNKAKSLNANWSRLLGIKRKPKQKPSMSVLRSRSVEAFRAKSVGTKPEKRKSSLEDGKSTARSMASPPVAPAKKIATSGLRRIGVSKSVPARANHATATKSSPMSPKSPARLRTSAAFAAARPAANSGSKVVDPYCQSQWDKEIRRRSFCYHRPKSPIAGRQIVYWMTGCPRVEDNWGLLLAMRLSRLLNLPLVTITFIPRRVHEAVLAKEDDDDKVARLHTVRAEIFRLTAICALRHRLRELNIPLVGLVVDDPPSQAAAIVRRWTEDHLTHAVICDETYDPPVRALNSVLLCCQADHDFCEQVMLSIMRSCIGGPGLGPSRCAVYSVDSNHIVPIRYAMLALTDDEKERVATENNGSGLGEGGEGQHKGCIGPRTYQALLMRSFKDNVLANFKWPFRRRLPSSKDASVTARLTPLSLEIQSTVANSHGTHLSVKLNPTFEGQYMPSMSCRWQLVDKWYNTWFPSRTAGTTKMGSNHARSSLNGSEEFAQRSLLVYTRGEQAVDAGWQNDQWIDPGIGCDHNFHATLPEELTGKGVALLLPFVGCGSLSSLYALQNLQQLGHRVPVAARRRSWALLATSVSICQIVCGNFGVDVNVMFVHSCRREYNIYRAFTHFTQTIGNARRFLSRMKQLAMSGAKVPRTQIPNKFSCASVEQLALGAAWDWVSFVPAWVRSDLERHETDTRKELHFAEALQEARTGDRLWDAIQRRLIQHGQLHPSLLGYWARRLLHWVQYPVHAFRFALRLIEQYAHGGLTPAMAAGVIITAYGKFQKPETAPHSSNGTLNAASDREVIGRLLPVRESMIQNYFDQASPGSFEKFVSQGESCDKE